MAAVIHHGGAGTTGAAFRAGVPQIICPFFGDQPFWGRRVVALGVGPQPIPRKRIRVHTLASAIQSATSDAGMRERAVNLGHKIYSEHGVERAASVITTLYG